MTKRRGLRSWFAVTMIVPVAALAACGDETQSDSAESTGATGSGDTPHGYVNGAVEATEPQLRLSVSDDESGETTMIDLLTEEQVEDVPETAGAMVEADGRYLFTRDDSSVGVVDTGVWAIDHGDHNHYYTSAPSGVGSVDGDAPGHIISNQSRVAVFFDGGDGGSGSDGDSGDAEVKVYPRSALDDGELTEEVSFTVGAHHGAAVPARDYVLTTMPGDSADDLPGTIAAFGEDGEELSGDDGLQGDTTCLEIHGATANRSGTFFACEDGLITEKDLDASLVDYPEQAQGRAWTLEVGRDLVAAPFEDGGVGLFDPSSEEWTVADTDAPVTSVAVAPDDSVLLALDENGTGYAIDPETGEVTAQRELVSTDSDSDSDSPAPAVALTRERGYVSDPSAGAVLEIDVRDDLREARQFDTGGTPTGIAVTGGL